MEMQQLQNWIVSCMLLALRVTPVFAFAPPFTLTRMPKLFHVLFGLGFSIALVSSQSATLLQNVHVGALVVAAGGELMLGMVFVLLMQLCFAGLQLAGRVIDIQAGLGLATLIDPVSRAQTPLVGTLFSYAAGALFFSMDGHLELLRILAMSLDAVPIGQWQMPHSLDHLFAFTAAIFIAALGVAGAAASGLFLIDVAIALLARTVPQMNVLVLGFQVKTIALLLFLPLCFGFGGALMIRMIRMTLEALPGFF